MTGELPFPDKPHPPEKEAGKAAETAAAGRSERSDAAKAKPAPKNARPGRGRKGRLFLLDGSALAYRSHFALIRQPLTTSKGQNVSALYIFANTLFRLIEQEHPDLLAVAFDPKGKTFRHERYEPYKATREKTPDELIAMLPAIRELAEGFRLPILEIEGFEADDVIATLAVEAEREGHEVYIVTGDKDFLQIVSPRVKLYNILRPDKDVEVQGVEAAEAKFGVRPDRVVDVLALMGDASDNVPGVQGVGPKTAAALVKDLGSVEEIYAHLDDVPKPGLRKKLEAGREQAFLSKELVTFDLRAPVEFDPETFAYEGPDAEKLTPLFRSYEMDSLLQRISVDQRDDEHVYHVVDDEETWAAFQERLAAADAFAFDTETTSIEPMRAELVGVALSFEEREAWYLPWNLDPPLFGGDPPDGERFLEALRGPLADPAVKKRAQNAKYDLLVLERAGLEVEGIDFDTMIASYCVSPGELQHNLDHLALKYLNFQKVKTTDLIGTGRKQITMREVPVEEVGRYAGEDVDMTQRLVPILRKELEAAGVVPLFETVEMPLLRVLAAMEREGVALDTALLERLGEDFSARIDRLVEEVHELAGARFNLNSPKQLGAVLFERLEIHKQFKGRRTRKTKTGWSTDARVLEQFREHPIVSKLLEYRMLSKLKGTYVEALPALVNPETGRIHTSFHQTVAATGRLSSADPNLQNIPIRTEDGRRIREAFVPGREGNLLLSADYSQVELRILAHLSGDGQLRRAFREGEDVHRWTASLIFGMEIDEVPPELRGRAKAINFGVVYGMGPQRLAQETGMSVGDAQEFIEAYFRTFSGVKALLDRTLEEARANGYVTTLLGRRRYISELDSKHPRMAAMARNVAVNTPIQGSAADLIKVAMIRLHERLAAEALEAKMILQVHDELVLDVPGSEIDRAKEVVVDVMEHAFELEVPLVVDVGTGRSWLEAH